MAPEPLGLRWWLSLAPARRDAKAAERPVRRLAVIAFAALVVQLMLGGWTSTNYAAVACPDFPTCQGQWLPQTEFSTAFALSHGPGIDYAGGVLAQPARTAIHFSHRIGALVVGSLLLLLSLSGCAAGAAKVALDVLAGLASAATVADKVVGIDVSIQQATPGKVPLARALAPAEK